MYHHTSDSNIPSSNPKVWRPNDPNEATPLRPGSTELYRPDILETIEAKIKEMDAELRELSLDIHAHPELGYKEYHAHDVYTAFMEKHGFVVTKNFHLDTAWKATFSHGTGGRTIGINSEMDALEGIGHGCGHNLVGMAGVAVACAIKTALEQHNLSGNVFLLGTPEEGGSGKVALLEKGAYGGIDACLMCHPGPGPIGGGSLKSSLTMQKLTIEYKGRGAHAALSPWEGINALDAVVLAYNNISALRQQLQPAYRVNGVFEGKDWTLNIIPDYAKFLCSVRAPTRAETQDTIKRLTACFEAAALATGCQVSIEHMWGSTFDLRQNKTLVDELTDIFENKYGGIDHGSTAMQGVSTDFGNVSHAFPSLHPGFTIPTVIDGGNHTEAFAEAAATTKAHYACLDICKALAATGVRVLTDDTFFAEVVRTFKEDEKEHGLP